MTFLDTYLEEEIDVRGLLDQVAFQEAEVMRAAETQPSLFLAASRFRVQAMRRTAKLESALQVLLAETGQELRRKHQKADARLTEAHLNQLLQTQPSVKKATALLQRAKVQEEFAKLALEAFRMRRDALRVVSEAANAEWRHGVSAQNQVQAMQALNTTKTSLRKKYPGRRS